MRPSVALAAGLLAALLATGRTTLAFERQHHIGGGVGVAALDAGSRTRAFFGAGAHYAYGISDAFNLMAEVTLTRLSFAEPAAAADAPHIYPGPIGTGGVGVAYVFDVLRWVPYAGALVGVGYLGGGNLDSARIVPDLQLAAGVDYQLTRSWAVGVAYREHVLTSGDYPFFATCLLRVEHAWGW